MARKSTRRTRPSNAPLKAALAKAAWAEADRALARALADLSALDGAQTPAARKAGWALVAQSLNRAGRCRNLARLGMPGDIVAYDPGQHEGAAGAIRAGTPVRIVTPGVARGGAALVRAQVARIRARAPG